MLQEGLYSNQLVERTTLPNGLTIVTEKIPNLRSLSVGFWVKRGSRHEDRQVSGIFHFIEHMLFKGTETRSTQAIARVIDSIGGEMNAFTGKESTCFYARVLDEHLPLAIDLMADLLLHPTFRPIDVERERKVILEEIKMVSDTPEEYVNELLVRSFWKGTALARPILGTRKTVLAMTPELLHGFFRDNVRPDSLLISAAGNLDHEAFVDRLWNALHDLKGSAPGVSAETPQFRPSVVTRPKSGLKQSHLCVGTPCYRREHADRYAVAVLETILGAGMSSRLFQKIREEKSLAYDVYCDSVSYQDTGYLVVYAGAAPESVRDILSIVLEEFASLAREPVSAEELSQAKEQLKGSLMLGLESTFNRMSNLATQEFYFGRQFSLDEILEGISAVTAEDLLRVAREILRADQVSLAILGKLHEGFLIDRSALTH